MPPWRSSPERVAARVAAGVMSMLLAACAARPDAGRLTVQDAALRPAADGAVLALALDCQFGETQRAALEHGIPLVLRIDVAARAAQAWSWPWSRRTATRHVELRYFPLSRRYQLRELESGAERSFAASAYLTDALGALRLPLPAAFAALDPGSRVELHVRLDREALPGALRLPAMVTPAWRLPVAEYAWTPDAG